MWDGRTGIPRAVQRRAGIIRRAVPGRAPEAHADSRPASSTLPGVWAAANSRLESPGRLCVRRLATEEGSGMHPYREAYYRQELESMAAVRPMTIGSLRLSRQSSPGLLDGYLYTGHLAGHLTDVPVLRLGGRVWMSLTPMEVQSSY